MSVKGPNIQFFNAVFANMSEEAIDKIIQDPQFDPNKVVNGYSAIQLAILASNLNLFQKLVKKGSKYNESDISKCLANGDFDIFYWLAKEHSTSDIEKSEASKKAYAEVNRYKADMQERHSISVRSNISQGKIMRKLRKYIELKRSQNPALYPEPYYSHFMENILQPLGFCNGYSLLWLYKKRFGMEEEYLKNLETISDWEEDLNGLNKNISETDNLDNLFRDMLDNILFAQDPRHFQADVTQLDWDKVIKAGGKSENEIEKQFSIPLVVTKKELETVLPECIEEGIVQVANNVHVTGYLNENGNISYFDPNNKQLNKPFDIDKNPNELSKLVQSALGNKTDSDNSTMGIVLIQYDKPTTPDSDKEREARNQKNIKKKIDLLDRIYESRKKAGVPDPINQMSSWGETTLSLACKMGDLDVVNWCLAKGADMRLNDNLVELAVDSGSFEVIKILFEKALSDDEANENESDDDEDDEEEHSLYVDLIRNALSYAAIKGNEKIIKELLNYLKQADCLNSEMISAALNSYIQNNSGVFSLIRSFVECGADLNSDPSSLIIAINKNNIDMVRELLKYSQLNLKKDNPLSLSFSKALNVNKACKTSKFSSENITPLLAAVQSKSLAMCEALIEAGADVNFVDPSWDKTILEQAMANNDDKMVKLLIANASKEPLLKDESLLWIKSEESNDEEDSDDEEPYDPQKPPYQQWEQAWMSLKKIAQESFNKYKQIKKPAEQIILHNFIELGAKLNKQIVEAGDMRQAMIMTNNSCNEVVGYFETHHEVFKASGINVESFIKNVRAIERIEKFIAIGNSIFFAPDKPTKDALLNELTKLFELGVNPNLNLFKIVGKKISLLECAIYHQDYDLAQKLLKFVNINHTPDSPPRNNVLMSELEKKIVNKDFVLNILSKNINLQYRNANGDTGLMIALRHTHEKTIDKEIILTLIEKSEDINRANDKKETPLLIYLQSQRDPDPDIISALLERNADVHHSDNRGETILQFAKSIHGSKPEMMKLLNDYSTKKTKPSVIEKQPPTEHSYHTDTWQLGQFTEHQQAQRKINLSDDVKELDSEWKELEESVRTYELQRDLSPEAIENLQTIIKFFDKNPKYQADSFKKLNDLVTPLQQSNKDPNMESLFKKILRVRKDILSL